ncbi:hypothetical protein D9Q98_005057 [Chlorella vulgaris]|uniref:procollagen-proline 4-dioxygenase n=1 Tax=Chlorella vulgaris TaxID=3077 RepID=A0A9D4TNE4_CHLVU|nr:hypothetical protein D9Q98_005057 [Chlorella vulgaris]
MARRRHKIAAMLVMAAAGLLLLPATSAQPMGMGNSTGWIEVVSWRPRALLLHGFLAHAECDHIVELATPRLEPSKVVSKDGSGRLDSVRTSKGAFLRKQLDEVMVAIEQRIERVTHLPFTHSEQLQVLKYDKGQKYSAHFDVHGDEQQAQLAARRGEQGGSRLATLLMYLSDVEEGGETSFPRGRWLDEAVQSQPPYSECAAKGVAVKPRKGDAILFFSLKLDGQSKDLYSLHAGCPVGRGVKYSATSWIHVEPYSNSGPLHPGTCRDNNANCAKWAAIGECERNVVFMKGNDTLRGNCRLACKVCKPCAADDQDCLAGNLTPAEKAAAGLSSVTS